MFEKPHYEELTTPAVDVLRGTLNYNSKKNLKSWKNAFPSLLSFLPLLQGENFSQICFENSSLSKNREKARTSTDESKYTMRDLWEGKIPETTTIN